MSREEFFEDTGEDEVDVGQEIQDEAYSAVVTGTDWTTETIVSQLVRGNIDLSPRFQRRDAWAVDRKSRLIESLILGLPVPQIVLAESKERRGKFLVLDGKQRLLSILQFWGESESKHNGFSLKGLTLRKDLAGVDRDTLENSGEWDAEFDALCNQVVRTVVIKNWQSSAFLHTVFLRLNTGSVSLSPQELRQALMPGPFSDFIDDRSAVSEPLSQLLNLDGPDPRMRDVEILARYLGFSLFAESYPGRMKSFLDDTFDTLNGNWEAREAEVTAAVAQFELGVTSLLQLFDGKVARKPGSRQFNRAIFDALIYFQARPAVRDALDGKGPEFQAAYDALFSPGADFSAAVESDTAGKPNTRTRFSEWAAALSEITGQVVEPPGIPD